MDNEQITKNRHMSIPVDQDGVCKIPQWPWNLPAPSATPSNQQQACAIGPPFSHDLALPSIWSPAPEMIAPPTRRQPSHVASNVSPVVAPTTRRQLNPAKTGRTYSLPYSTQRLLELHRRTAGSRAPTPGIPAPPAAAPHQQTNDDRDAMLRARYGNLYRPLNRAPRGRPILGRKQ